MANNGGGCESARAVTMVHGSHYIEGRRKQKKNGDGVGAKCGGILGRGLRRRRSVPWKAGWSSRYGALPCRCLTIGINCGHLALNGCAASAVCWRSRGLEITWCQIEVVWLVGDSTQMGWCCRCCLDLCVGSDLQKTRFPHGRYYYTEHGVSYLAQDEDEDDGSCLRGNNKWTLTLAVIKFT